jgi:hypothetical protein
MQAQVAQVAAQNFDWWRVVITAAASLFAAFGATTMTLWWQNRREKREAKLDLFMALMAHRKANPPTPDWVRAANLIDVIFAKDAEVLGKWHALYRIISDQSQLGSQEHQHTLLELLSEMAKVLGYRNLQQTDIDKFYVPPAYLMQAVANAQVQNEILNIFRTMGKLMDEKIKEAQSATPPELLPQKPEGRSSPPKTSR